MGRTVADLFDAFDREGIHYVTLALLDHLEATRGGLDLLVRPDHRSRLLTVLGATDPEEARFRIPIVRADGQSHWLVTDVRSPGDGYFPEDFALRLLEARERRGNRYMLPGKEYILCLLYQAVHHLGVMHMLYVERIAHYARSTDLDLDAGKLFDLAYCDAFLASRGIRPVVPEDPSVAPFMPYLHPIDTLLWSNACAEHSGRLFHSRIYKLCDEHGRTFIRKQATQDLADREHAFLSALAPSPCFPGPLGLRAGPGSTVLDMEFIEGPLLEEEAGIAAVTGSAAAARAFILGCLEVLEILAREGITHRDVKADNIRVRDGMPVLLDFGWAISAERPYFEPTGLNAKCRPPDHCCDVYSMGFALAGVVGLHPEFARVVAAMTTPALADRTTDVASLRELLDRESWRFSVVICVHDQLAILERCLEALVEHTPSELFEVVIVDNGSTDDTPRFLRGLEGDVKVVSNSAALGFAEACDQGSQVATGRYLVFLDPRAQVAPGWLDGVASGLEGDDGKPGLAWRILDAAGALAPVPAPGEDFRLERGTALVAPTGVFRRAGGLTCASSPATVSA